jgi:hypothetical protein
LRQTAIGGKGGNSSGGTAGLGGNAVSSLTINQSGETLSGSASATGGAGGNGTNGSAGANGGTATAAADLTDSGGIGLSLTAAGGRGGSSSGNADAGNGAAGFISHASVTSTGGNGVFVQVGQGGGSGGDANGTGHGGNGASSILVDAISASSSAGKITLQQTALAGSGGMSTGGIAGMAGNAISDLTFTNPGTGDIDVDLRSFGGLGGRGVGSDGRAGGTAESSFHIVGQSAITVFAEVDGGSGGEAIGSGKHAGNGTAATLNPSMVSGTGDSDVMADVLLQAGAGGQAEIHAIGGNGADANLIDAISGSSNGGLLSLSQTARGGRGGDALVGSVAGLAGNATSILHVKDSETASALMASSVAEGGFGGTNYDGDPSDGGSATAMVFANNAHSVVVQARAIGGNGGQLLGAGEASSGGDATAIAAGISSGPVDIFAEAGGGGSGGFSQGLGLGGSGLARAAGTGSSASFDPEQAVNAVATSSGASIGIQSVGVKAETHASLPGTSKIAATSTVESRATVARTAPSSSLASGLQAASFATGAPLSSDLAARESGNPNVSNAIGTGGNVFGLMTLGASYATNGSGAIALFQASAIFTVNIDSTEPLPLRLGLLNPVVSGGGFDMLTFSILDSGTLIEFHEFTDVSQATAFFTDHVLTYDIKNGGSAEFTFYLSVKASSPGDGFRTDLIAAVPEPRVELLVFIGAIALIVLVRRLKVKVALFSNH